MSRIYVHVYDGDSTEYDPEREIETVGSRESPRSSASGGYRYGEELDAAAAILGLLRDGKHFDVRQEIN